MADSWFWTIAKYARQRANTETRIACSRECSDDREWHAKFSPGWVASHGDRILRRLERNVFPWLGKRPIAEIKAPDLLSMLRRIESRGALETTIGRCRMAGRYFATPWRPVVLNATPQAFLAAPLPHHQKKSIMPRLSSRSVSRACSAPSTLTSAFSPLNRKSAVKIYDIGEGEKKCSGGEWLG
jgi:hypothetical protein